MNRFPLLGISTHPNKPSCLRCRGRRSFCSKEKPKCLRCREGGFECKYETSERVTVTVSYVRGLQDQIRVLEGTSP